MGIILNQQKVAEIAAEIREEIRQKSRRARVSKDVLDAKVATLNRITEPFAAKVKAGTASKNDLLAWRAALKKAGLSYIDYSKQFCWTLESRKLVEMLDDRLARPRVWARAAIVFGGKS